MNQICIFENYVSYFFEQLRVLFQLIYPFAKSNATTVEVWDWGGGGGGGVISSYALLRKWLLIHTVIKVVPC